MPSAPPSSDAVSEMPDAAPARSGGAEPTMSSVVREKTGARPSEMMTEPSDHGGEAVRAADLGQDRRGRSADEREARADDVRRGTDRRTIRGASVRADDEARWPTAATRGRPRAARARRTSCRYWATNRK